MTPTAIAVARIIGVKPEEKGKDLVMRHTPWFMSQNRRAVNDAQGNQIAYLGDTQFCSLIAAAPEMLEALKRIAECVEICHCDPEFDQCPHPDNLVLTPGADAAIPYIRGAIAKAEGREDG